MSTRSVGNAAERQAAQFLEEKYGYKIVARNYSSRFGEVDIIAEDGPVLCFIEVRMRTTSRYGEAIESVSLEKRRRIARTARQFLVVNSMEDRVCRFDMVTIQNMGQPQLLRDAFYED